MNNFDLRKFLAEGKLYEAMSPQDVVDIADTVAEEFTKESADEGEFLVYSVGKMEADDMSFELDTDVTSQTPKGIDTRGVGEGWGGIFRIKPTADGYEVRNAEKGGLVAMIDTMGNFKMLSADESRAEMGLEETEEDDFLELVGQGVDSFPRPSLGEEEIEEEKSNKMKKSELKEMIRAAFLNEAEDEEVEDVEIDTEEEIEDVDVDVDADMEDAGEMDVEDDAKVELTGDKAAVSDNLEAALEAARALGDEKLVDQIGNTITFFTRAHIVKEAEMELEEIQNSPELEKAKEDYKAGKISLADYQAIVKKLDPQGVKDAEAAGQAKKDAIAAKNKDYNDKKAKVKQAEEDRKAGKISQEEFAKIVQANQYINKENLNESFIRMQRLAGIKK